MHTREYTVRFTTPAFLGDAYQNGAWRTPPFKALLRQWWRVVVAAECKYSVGELRRREGELFGSAHDDGGGSNQSQVRVRLREWRQGRLQGDWGNDPRVHHPEVGQQGREIGAHLYLGYGPLRLQQGTRMKSNAALQAEESVALRLAWPDDEQSIAPALKLIHWFGSIGGRSRNGWGSFELLPEGTDTDSFAALSTDDPVFKQVASPVGECLQRDWPHAIGMSADGRLLIWRSHKPFNVWREAMKHLAEIKIRFRTRFGLHAQGPFQKRHLLAYPVTNHSVDAWGNQARLANQLRFKVAKEGERFVPIAFHLPCALPDDLSRRLGREAPSRDDQSRVWRQVHDVLDESMQRIG